MGVFVLSLSLHSWLYALFLGIDANFRLKRKKVSSEERDPSLGPGWCFFVEETGYKKHLAEHWDDKQPVCCTCVLCFAR